MSASSTSAPQSIPRASLQPSTGSGSGAQQPQQQQQQGTIDPSLLNQQPASIPTSPPSTSPGSGGVQSPPLRSVDGPGVGSGSAAGGGAGGATGGDYLGGQETASDPTVAETGDLSSSPSNPGPVQGQLRRVPGGERKASEGIIRLASLGGEGLIAKPPKAEGEEVPRFGGVEGGVDPARPREGANVPG